MFPKLFGRIAQIYFDKYGATEEDLAQVAWKNYAHAKLNPLAQMRDADLTLDCASQVSDKNPSVAPPLKVSDCSQITDGAASVVLVSGKYLEKIGRDKNKTARLLGFGHTTDYLPLDKKDAPTFSTARKAAEKAFSMANLKPQDIQGAEVHDCFSITEIVAYEILGLAESGKGVDLVKSGASFADVAVEMSTDSSAPRGGLLEPISEADPAYPAPLVHLLDALPEVRELLRQQQPERPAPRTAADALRRRR